MIQNDGGNVNKGLGALNFWNTPVAKKAPPKTSRTLPSNKVPAKLAKPVAPARPASPPPGIPGRSANSIEGRSSANNNYSGRAGTAKGWTSAGAGAPRVSTFAPDPGTTAATTQAAQTVPTDEDWLNNLDPLYKANINSLLLQLTSYQKGVDRERGNYENDFKGGLKSLGYQDNNDNLADNYDKATGKPLDGTGSWLWSDRATSAGRGRNSIINDFAGRGALRSSDFLQATTDLERSLGDQLTSMFTSRQRANQDWDQQLSDYKLQTGFDDNGNVKGGQAASEKAAALARKAAQYTTFPS